MTTTDKKQDREIKVHLVLDNIRSAFNVGSLFRTADATGCTKLYLCGITPEVDNPKLIKTALGATETVESEYHADTFELVKSLKEKGIPVYAVEIAKNSEDYREIEFPDKVALIMGHEITGVNQHILDECDKVVHIPMRGEKKSLNVATAAGIMMFEAIRNMK